MPATREQIMQALLVLCQALPGINAASRRNPGPERLTQVQTPAVFLLESGERYERRDVSLPPTRILRVTAIFYVDVGTAEALAPTTPLNNILDAFDAALVSDFGATGRFTLGGLVNSCVVTGEVEKAPGDITGKSLAAVPLEITMGSPR